MPKINKNLISYQDKELPFKKRKQIKELWNKQPFNFVKKTKFLVLKKNTIKNKFILEGKNQKDQLKQEEPIALTFKNENYYFYPTEIKKININNLKGDNFITLNKFNKNDKKKIKENLDKFINEENIKNSNFLTLKIKKLEEKISNSKNNVKNIKEIYQKLPMSDVNLKTINYEWEKLNSTITKAKYYTIKRKKNILQNQIEQIDRSIQKLTNFDMKQQEKLKKYILKNNDSFSKKTVINHNTENEAIKIWINSRDFFVWPVDFEKNKNIKEEPLNFTLDNKNYYLYPTKITQGDAEALEKYQLTIMTKFTHDIKNEINESFIKFIKEENIKNFDILNLKLKELNKTFSNMKSKIEECKTKIYQFLYYSDNNKFENTEKLKNFNYEWYILSKKIKNQEEEFKKNYENHKNLKEKNYQNYKWNCLKNRIKKIDNSIKNVFQFEIKLQDLNKCIYENNQSSIAEKRKIEYSEQKMNTEKDKTNKFSIHSILGLDEPKIDINLTTPIASTSNWKESEKTNSSTNNPNKIYPMEQENYELE